MVGKPKIASASQVGVSSSGHSVVLVKVSQIPWKVTQLSGDTDDFSDDFESRAQRMMQTFPWDFPRGHRRAGAGQAPAEAGCRRALLPGGGGVQQAGNEKVDVLENAEGNTLKQRV